MQGAGPICRQTNLRISSRRYKFVAAKRFRGGDAMKPALIDTDIWERRLIVGKHPAAPRAED